MSSFLGIFLILLVNAIFASVFSLEQLSVIHAYPFFITGLRMLLGGMLVIIYQKIVHPESLNFKEIFSKRFTIQILFLLAMFNFYLTNGFETWGLQYLSGAKTAFIYNLAPFMSAFFAYIHFDEHMTPKKWMGLIISFIGFLPVIFSQNPSEEHLLHMAFLSTAELAIIIASASFVYGAILMQKLVRKKYYNIFLINGIGMLMGAVLCFVHSLLVEPWNPVPIKADGNWLALSLIIIAMVILYNIIAYGSYLILLKQYTATFLSFSSFFCYLFAALFDWLFMGVLVPTSLWIGSIIFFIGLYIFYKEELSQGYINK